MTGQQGNRPEGGVVRPVVAGSEWQGRSVDASDPGDLREALVAAADYRGDVSIELRDGTTLAGYLFHCDAAGSVAKMLCAGSDERVTVHVADVRVVRFTGDDKAAGKSWAAWVARHEEKKRLAAQGVDVGDIEPRPEPLD